MGTKRKHQQQWNLARIGGHKYSLTSTIKQHGKQRLRNIRNNADELREVSIRMAKTASCKAMRDAALTLLMDEGGRIASVNQHREPSNISCDDSQSINSTKCLFHVDWGAGTGVLAQRLAQKWTGSMPLSSRSFDILPAGSDVEFMDMSAELCEATLHGDSVDLASGVANLMSAKDVPGFFASCARTLRRADICDKGFSGGALVLVQPLAFLGATMSLLGAGRLLGPAPLFVPEILRFRDLEVRDKGDGPTRVVELVLRRTSASCPPRTELMDSFYEPILGRSCPVTPRSVPAICPAGLRGNGFCCERSLNFNNATCRLLGIVRALKATFVQRLLGACRPLPALITEFQEAFDATHTSQSVAELRFRLALAQASSCTQERKRFPWHTISIGSQEVQSNSLPAKGQSGSPRGTSSIVYAIFFSVRKRVDAEKLVTLVSGEGKSPAASPPRLNHEGEKSARVPRGKSLNCAEESAFTKRFKGAEMLARYLSTSISAWASDLLVGSAGSDESDPDVDWIPLCAHFDYGASENLDRWRLPTAMAQLVQLCKETNTSHRVEVVELWASDMKCNAAQSGRVDDWVWPHGFDRRLFASHTAECIVLLLQSVAGSYLRGGVGLHKQLGARRGKRGR